MSGSYITKLELDDTDFSPKAKKVVQEISQIAAEAKKQNDTEARNIKRLDQLRTQAGQAARAARDAQFKALPAEEQLARLTERQVNLQNLLNRAIAQGNTQRQTAIRLAQSFNNSEINTLKAGGAGAGGGFSSRGKAALGALASGAGGLLLGGGSAGLGGLIGGVAGSAFGPEGTVIGGAIGSGAGALVSKYYSAAKSREEEFRQMASAIKDGAEQLETTPEKFQEYTYAAKKSGAASDDVSKSFKTLIATQGAAVQGSKEHADAFRQFGFDAEALRKLKPEQIFDKISEAAAKPLNITQQAALMKLLGESAFNLSAAFRKGFGDARKEARDTGAVIDNEVIATIDELGERMERNSLRMKAAFAPLALEATKFAEKFSSALTNAGDAVKVFIQKYRETGKLDPSYKAAVDAFKAEQQKDALERANFTQQQYRLQQLAKIEKALAAERNLGRQIDLKAEADKIRELLGLSTKKAKEELNNNLALSTIDTDAKHKIGGYLGSIPTQPGSAATSAWTEAARQQALFHEVSSNMLGTINDPALNVDLRRLPAPAVQQAEMNRAVQQVISDLSKVVGSLNSINSNTANLEKLSEE